MFESLLVGYRWIFLQLASIVGCGWAIVALSIICSLLMAPLMASVAGIVRREKEYEDVILPQITAIKARYASDAERNFHIQRLYSRYSYSPICAVKKVLPLFVQIPFLLLTYYMLKGTAEIQGVHFLFLQDLGKPDALIPIVHAHLLPVAMTGINILTVFATPSFTHRDWVQTIAIALLFLILLYTAPSALLLYWTLNNLISFVKVLIGQRGRGGRLLYDRMMRFRLPEGFWATIGLLILLSSLYLLITARLYAYFFPGFSYFVASKTWAYLPALAFGCFVLSAWRSHGVCRWSCTLAGLTALYALAIVIYPLSCRGILPKCLEISCLPMWVYCTGLILFPVIQTEYARAGKRLKEFISASFLLALPIVLALHYASANVDFTFSFISKVKLACYSLLVPLAVMVWSVACAGRSLGGKRAAGLSAGFVLGVFMMPLLNVPIGGMDHTSNILLRLGLLVLLALGVAFLLHKARRGIVLFTLFAVVFEIGAELYAELFGRESITQSAELPAFDESPFAPLLCQRKNNIYFLIYDGYPNPKYLDALGVERGDADEYLSSKGFSLYPDAYSAGPDTLDGMRSMFACGGCYLGSPRSTVAGNNVFCEILRRSGYKMYYLLCGYLMPLRGERLPGDFYFPSVLGVKKPEEVIFGCIMRGVLSQSPQTFNEYTEQEWLTQKRTILRKDLEGPRFIYAHQQLPAHLSYDSGLRGSDAACQLEYAERIRRANEQIREDIDDILANDKTNPLVIVAGDHGGILIHPQGEIQYPDSAYILDRYGAYLAVRWPAGFAPTVAMTCLPDATLNALIYLTGDETLSRFQYDGSTIGAGWDSLPERAVQGGYFRTGEDKGKPFVEAGVNAIKQGRQR